MFVGYPTSPQNLAHKQTLRKNPIEINHGDISGQYSINSDFSPHLGPKSKIKFIILIHSNSPATRGCMKNYFFPVTDES